MENPWLERRVLAYAHQGGAKEGPSSTLYAIELALANGADAIELDVHPSAEGELVVLHDPTLEGTTDGAGLVSATPLARLRQLDNAYLYVEGEAAVTGRPPSAYVHRGRAPADRRFGVALLEEVLASFPGVYLNLDVKQGPPSVEPYEATLAGVLAAHGRRDDVIVASFDDRATDAFHSLCPEIGTSLGIGAVTRFVLGFRRGEPPDPSVRRHVALQVPVRFAGVEIIEPRLIEVAHELGLAVHTWTVDDEEEMTRLVGLGVDGVMTDFPSVLARVLARLGAAFRA